MIYNIPYNRDFIEILANKAPDSLLILPGKHLTDVFKNRGLHAMSYDDLWFKILPSRASHIAESIILNRAIKGHYAIRTQLRNALNEFFYYGLHIKDLVCMNAQHDLLQQTVIELHKLLETNNLSLRSGTLQNILNSELHLDFEKPVYAVLPVIFSPMLCKVLQIFREQFNFNIVMHGYDTSIDYDISPNHPQYFMREFLKSIDSVDVLCLKSHSIFDNQQHHRATYNVNLNISDRKHHLKTLDDDTIFSIPQDLRLDNIHYNEGKIHPDEINKGLSQLMYPAIVLYRLHNESLYQFNHIEKFTTQSMAEEFMVIQSVIEKSNFQNISIVSKNAEKLKLLYGYLNNALKTSKQNYKIRSSTPTYCYDYQELRLFFKVLDIIGLHEVSLTEIFDLLKHSKYNQEVICLAEKVLLEAEELHDKNLKDAEKILEKHELFEALELIRKIASFSDIYSVKDDFELPIKLSDSDFDKILRGHMMAYITINGSVVDDELIQLLLEAQRYMGEWHLSLQEYKHTMLELGMRTVISSSESFTTNNKSDFISIDLLTAVERRFLSYDLTIICDLQEEIWPPAVEDHFFISEHTRRISGYTRPANYEVGYAAHDFVSIIGSSKSVIISDLKTTEILSQDALKRLPIESRFLSILSVYREISGVNVTTYNKDKYSNDELQLNSKAVMNIPLEHRPRAISATSLEKLMKNPYLYSLEYSLHLKYLRKSFNQKVPLPSNREFGIILHNILNHTSKKLSYKESYNDFCAIFQSITRSLMTARYGIKTEYMMTFWNQKFNNIIQFIYNYNQELYKKNSYDLYTESEKTIAFHVRVGKNNIKLHACVDRLDCGQNSLYISDYKTGQLPSKHEIITGLKSQLNLEALIMVLLDNNFDFMNENIDTLRVKETILRYIRLTGIESTNEIKDIVFDLQRTFNGIKEILNKLYVEVIPYSSTDKYDNYLQAHIMRIFPIIEHNLD
jgi:RecB family exonuclease